MTLYRTAGVQQFYSNKYPIRIVWGIRCATLASPLFYFTRGQHTFGVLAYFRRFLCIIAVYNLKTKSSGIILTPWAMFVPIIIFLHFYCFGFLRYRVKKNMLILAFWFILAFFANFATNRKLFQKPKCAHHPRTRRHLCTKFYVLRLSQSWDIVWKTTVTHTNTQTPNYPAYYVAIRKPLIKCSKKNQNYFEVSWLSLLWMNKGSRNTTIKSIFLWIKLLKLICHD